MKKKKLNYRFHNPNTAEATADILLKVFIEANSKKVEKAVEQFSEENVAKHEMLIKRKDVPKY